MTQSAKDALTKYQITKAIEDNDFKRFIAQIIIMDADTKQIVAVAPFKKQENGDIIYDAELCVKAIPISEEMDNVPFSLNPIILVKEAEEE